jgi:hypothetical protein
MLIKNIIKDNKSRIPGMVWVLFTDSSSNSQLIKQWENVSEYVVGIFGCENVDEYNGDLPLPVVAHYYNGELVSYFPCPNDYINILECIFNSCGKF